MQVFSTLAAASAHSQRISHSVAHGRYWDWMAILIPPPSPRGSFQRPTPALANKIQFACRGIETLEDGQRFDFVFSKDAFEHILDLEGTVSHIHRLLRPGGRLVIGTSPH